MDGKAQTVQAAQPTIAVLDPHVIDQIAAGEVIERPSSVVKELTDNAVDAGAGAIAIEVAAGGRALIRVTDDGSGMSPKDAVLALERHATSKLRALDDLWGIASLGFRGEALPSIASVSRMTLTTRRTGDDAATRIEIAGGRLVAVTETGAAVGTTVEVADLLYNVPARLKFLKGEATEASHITELVGKLAMAYPRLHIRLRHNGRTALDAPPDRDGFARAQALLGPRIAERMVPVVGEESGVRVTGYLGAPELAQTTARGVQLFVGRRPVRDRGLLHAVGMGYGELVPRGRYPFAIVLLDLPAGTVDVNVHPQKLEVRFSDPAVVAAAVRHVVQSGIAAARWRDGGSVGAPVQLVGVASVAPPVLPFDGRVATPLAERSAAEANLRWIRPLQSPQMPLGFGPAPEVAAARAYAAPARPASGAGADFASTVSDGASPTAAADAPRGAFDGTRSGPAMAAPGAASSDAAIRPRDWARNLREQTRAARAAEPRAEYTGAFAEPDAAGHPAGASIPASPDGFGGSAASASGGFGGSAASASGDFGGSAASASGDFGGPAGGAGGDFGGVGASPGGFGDSVVSATGGFGDLGHVPASSRGGLGDLADSAAVATGGFGDAAGDLAVDPARDPARGAPLGRAVLPALGSGTGPIVMRAPGWFSQLRYLGQLDLTYLVCEADGELALIDQHAAHERVELARLRERHQRGGEPRVAVQSMLFPVTIDAAPAQLELVERVGGLLAQVGFDVEPFGKATLAIKAVPAGIRHGDPAQLLRRLLHDWTATGVPGAAERDARLDALDALDALLGAIACHSVVRAGDRLGAGEAETLLRSLDGLDLSLPAPHGRAMLLRLPLAEIGRRFGR